GITGSGKTYTAACVIEALQRPTLIMAHNKTLAAQLYGEFRELFPESAVHYFVSYYDYYQPEAYVVASDTFIEKDSLINEEIDRMRGKSKGKIKTANIFPASHYVTPASQLVRAIDEIKIELRSRLGELSAQMKLVEKQRLEQRTMFDIEMLEQMGHCNGIENYSRHLSGRAPGEPPPTLIDYFPKDFLLFVDESHQTVPQVQSMYRGDRSRKETLVEYGFRMPS